MTTKTGERNFFAISNDNIARFILLSFFCCCCRRYTHSFAYFIVSCSFRCLIHFTKPSFFVFLFLKKTLWCSKKIVPGKEKSFLFACCSSITPTTATPSFNHLRRHHHRVTIHYHHRHHHQQHYKHQLNAQNCFFLLAVNACFFFFPEPPPFFCGAISFRSSTPLLRCRFNKLKYKSDQRRCHAHGSMLSGVKYFFLL